MLILLVTKVTYLVIVLKMGAAKNLAYGGLTSVPDTSVIPPTTTYPWFDCNQMIRIRVGDLAPFTQLEDFSIFQSFLEYIEDGAFDNNNELRELDLGDNYIHHLPLSFGPPKLHLWSVKLWNAFDKNVVNLDLGDAKQFPSLTKINIGNVPLDIWDLSKMPPRVTYINVNLLPLGYFPNFAPYTPNITILSMSGLGLSYIPRFRIQALKQLEKMNIRNNDLQSLPDIFDLPLTEIEIGNNPLECNHSLRSWNEKKSTPLSVDDVDAICQAPATRSGEKLMEVHPVYLQCYEGAPFVLTRWPLGDLDAILKLQFLISFYRLVSSHHLRIMPWDECHGTSPMISQHWFR